MVDPHDDEDCANAAAALEQHPDYKILRRFKRRPAYHHAADGTVLHKALMLDVETTGLNTDTDSIIEFGAVYFTFDEDGLIYTVGPQTSSARRPATRRRSPWIAGSSSRSSSGPSTRGRRSRCSRRRAQAMGWTVACEQCGRVAS